MPKRSHGEMEESSPVVPVVLRRLMNPKDANIFHTVHGGNIMQLMDEAGKIQATKIFKGNQTDASDKSSCWAILTRVDKVSFCGPVFVGDVVEAQSDVLHTSGDAVLVSITIYAEHILKGNRRITNKARFWYTAGSSGQLSTAAATLPTVTGEENGVHDQQSETSDNGAEKQSEQSGHIVFSDCATSLTATPHSVPYSRTHTTELLNPEHLTPDGHCQAGVLLKLIDECAGITTAKHCGTKVATVSFDGIVIERTAPKGNVLVAHGRPTFTSNRSLEVEVEVYMENVWNTDIERARVAHGFATFVSLTDDNKPLQMPALKIENPDESLRYKEGKSRYDEQKLQRSSRGAPPAAAANRALSR